MIVLIDVKNQDILLYKEEGLIRIPFNEAGSIMEHTGEDKIPYVTNAINVSSDDIINLINSMGIKSQVQVETSTNKYLCGTMEGMIYINENLKFEGKYDCKLIDANMKKVIKESNLLQTLIKNRKIEIIGELKRSKLRKELKKSQENLLKNQSKRDESLDTIIMNTKVGDWDGIVSEEDNSNDNTIVIDLEKGGRTQVGGGISVNTMSELMSQIEGIEN